MISLKEGEILYLGRFSCKNQMQLDLDQSKQMRLCDIYYENIPIFGKLEFESTENKQKKF